MANTLAKHGSEAGYRAELSSGNVCERCRNAHRVFNKQYTKGGKANGLHYDKHEVIDQLYSGTGVTRRRPGRDRTGQDRTRKQSSGYPVDAPENAPTGQDGTGAGEDVQTGQASLGERVAAGVKSLWMPQSDDYVPVDEIPDYLTPGEADPEPAGEWQEVTDEEFVINAAGMKKIEENLGTYLSVVGMTVEMIDPYCGPILAENFDNIVNRWSKVIAHYPRAAKMFLDTRGGTLMSWMGALQATWPVLYALYEHHLSKSVRTEDGRIYKIHPNGQRPDIDATMPPMDGYNYTAQ